jgi:putative restriction endonuclease
LVKPVLESHLKKGLKMKSFTDLIANLPKQHQNALTWFFIHSGSKEGWPDQLGDGTILASKAKGIYKPNWTKYALSIRESLSGPYNDHEPIYHSDGTWSYLYFQENQDPHLRDTEYTNRGLVECMKDKIPIGVFRQVKEKPNPKYQILGVALVARWEEGYFFLDGFSQDGLAQGSSLGPQIQILMEKQQKEAEKNSYFSPNNIIEGRERILASIVRRRGQPEFRRILLEIYGGRCVVTGCDVEEALEACHIIPYHGPTTDHPSNGLLLRADIHTLFDLGLMSINSGSMTVLISDSLKNTAYSDLDGKQILLPTNDKFRPTKESLDYHREWASL